MRSHAVLINVFVFSVRPRFPDGRAFSEAAFTLADTRYDTYVRVPRTVIISWARRCSLLVVFSVFVQSRRSNERRRKYKEKWTAYAGDGEKRRASHIRARPTREQRVVIILIRPLNVCTAAHEPYIYIYLLFYYRIKNTRVTILINTPETCSRPDVSRAYRRGHIMCATTTTTTTSRRQCVRNPLWSASYTTRVRTT